LAHVRPALITIVVACLSAAPALALGDGPAIASDWDEMTVLQSDCFTRGETAIRRMGFGDIERTKYSRFATRDDTTVAVRCIEEKRMVLFLASGRDRKRAQSLQLDLMRNYLKTP
jgi:hypothetical protein